MTVNGAGGPRLGLVPSRAVAAAAMLGAAALWGVTGGLVAGMTVSGATAASIVELVTGIALCGLTAARGVGLMAVVAILGRRLWLLGLLEAINVVCYYVALQLAPVGPVMALHLCAPVLLTAALLLGRRRRLTPRLALTLAMIVGALVLIAAAGVDAGRYPHAAWGYVLAGLSAGCLALFVSGVGAVAPQVPPTAAAGVQMLASGLLLSPFLIGLEAKPADAVRLTLLSLLLFAPACWLYWTAMRRLAPVTASTILLAEPLFGTAVAAFAYGLVPTTAHLLAAALLLAGVYLDINDPNPAVHLGHARA